MGGSHQINVVSTLILKFQKDIPKLFHSQFFSQSLLADGVILTEAAFSSAAGEKYCSTAAGAADAWLLPVMQCCSGGFYSISTATKPNRNPAVDATGPGAEMAGGVIRKIHDVTFLSLSTTRVLH